jgi:hypothetical protein
MARYTCLVTVSAPEEQSVKQSVGATLESCNCNVIYEAKDYVVAREVPGNVAFPKLVTVEVLIDEKPEAEQTIRMNVVVKNEELPLQIDNHCRRVFDKVNQAIAQNESWQLIHAVVS